MQKPTIGRVVHYVLADGQHRAATVVNAWSNATPVNLVVHLDAANDLAHGNMNTGWSGPALKPNVRECGETKIYGMYLGGSELHVSSAQQDEENHTPGTWHWPERE